MTRRDTAKGTASDMVTKGAATAKPSRCVANFRDLKAPYGRRRGRAPNAPRLLSFAVGPSSLLFEGTLVRGLLLELPEHRRGIAVLFEIGRLGVSNK